MSKISFIKKIRPKLNNVVMDNEALFKSIISQLPPPQERTLEDKLRQPRQTFSQKVLSIIDAKSLKDPDVYKAARLDRRLFSRLRSEENYVPSKKTAICIAIGLKLDIKEAEELLAVAGYTFSEAYISDVIIKHHIQKREYDLDRIEEKLIQNNQTPLTK